MQRTRRTPLSTAHSPDTSGTDPSADGLTEPADPKSAGSPSSPPAAELTSGEEESAPSTPPSAGGKLQAGSVPASPAEAADSSPASAAADDAELAAGELGSDEDDALAASSLRSAANGGASAGSTPASPAEAAPSPPTSAALTAGGSARLVGLFVVVGLLVLAADQVTKMLALQHLTPGEPVNVIGTFLKFNLIRNPGAAFSLGSDFTPVISTIQIAVALGVVWFSRRLGSIGWAVAFGFLFGGAVGNIIDRIFREPSPFHGHVVDFLQTPHWAIFNVADMAVTSAAALLVIQTLRGIKLDGSRDVGKK